MSNILITTLHFYNNVAWSCFSAQQTECAKSGSFFCGVYRLTFFPSRYIIITSRALEFVLSDLV